MHYLPIVGRFRAEHVRNGEVIGTYEFNNAVKNAAKNSFLDVFFNSATHLTTWCIGLVDNSTYSSDPNADTMTSHAGWTEFSSYTVGSSDSTHRGTWSQGSAAGQAVTNSSPVVFTFSGSGTVWGVFVCSSNTKGDTSGLLWSSAALTAPLAVLSGDVLNITYTVAL